MTQIESPSHEVLTPTELASYLKVSKDWVYRNWKKLGGIKLGGFLRFPGKGDFYDSLFEKRALPLPILVSGDKVQQGAVQDAPRSTKRRTTAQRRVKESEPTAESRHGLW